MTEHLLLHIICTRCTDHTECCRNLKIGREVPETRFTRDIFYYFPFSLSTLEACKDEKVNKSFLAHFRTPFAKFQRTNFIFEEDFSLPFERCINLYCSCLIKKSEILHKICTRCTELTH